MRRVAPLLVSIGVGSVLVTAGWPREQAYASAILAGTALAWVTEALPLFATAFVSIAAQMFVLSNPGGWPYLGFEHGTGPQPRDFLGAAADPVLVLFFAGLVLARAISTSGLDRTIAAVVLRPLARTPATTLLGVIITTACFSLIMSNTATTALMLTLIAPMWQQLPAGAAFRKALILAVPLSANIAGMSTPISSPPNAIAVSYLARSGISIEFLWWIVTVVPLVVMLLALTWRWLLWAYPPGHVSASRLDVSDTRLSPTGAWVLVVALVTIAVWMTEPWHGVPAAMAAVLPVILLLVSSVVTREDVNTLDWDVLILIAGGLTLGYSLQVTAVDQRLASFFPEAAGDASRLGAVILATFVLGTFFSNTAIASMLMPVVTTMTAGVAESDVTGHALSIALVASLSMALPVSTPPNTLAHATGELDRRDFLRTAGYIGCVGAILIFLIFGFVRPWMLGR